MASSSSSSSSLSSSSSSTSPSLHIDFTSKIFKAQLPRLSVSICTTVVSSTISFLESPESTKTASSKANPLRLLDAIPPPPRDQNGVNGFFQELRSLAAVINAGGGRRIEPRVKFGHQRLEKQDRRDVSGYDEILHSLAPIWFTYSSLFCDFIFFV